MSDPITCRCGEQYYDAKCFVDHYRMCAARAKPQPTNDSLQEVADKVCGHIPEDMVISLCMENGAAWVELGQDRANNLELPDSADKTLVEQINDALCVANGWTAHPTNSEQGD